VITICGCKNTLPSTPRIPGQWIVRSRNNPLATEKYRDDLIMMNPYSTIIDRIIDKSKGNVRIVNLLLCS
jgi:hypothetical protein